MPAFTSEFIMFVALLLGAVLYVTVLVSAFRKRSGQELSAALLGIFTLMAVVFQTLDAFWRGGLIPQMDPRGFFELQIFGAVLLAFLLTLLVRSFLRLNGWWWLIAGAVWAVGLGLLDSNLPMMPEIL